MMSRWNRHVAVADPASPCVPNLAEHRPRDWQSAGYGEIVCHCEMVTLREIELALSGPLPAGDFGRTSGVARGAAWGRCQGFYCNARLAELTANHFASPLAVEDAAYAGAFGLARSTDVIGIGAGPAGLAAATQLKALGVPNVIVVDREQQAGGVPRHCGHPPFGMREFGRVLTGPVYARRLVERAQHAGVELRLGCSVVAIDLAGRLLSRAQHQAPSASSRNAPFLQPVFARRHALHG